MFSGIVEEAARIARLSEDVNSIRLAVNSPACAKGVQLGDSIAVNGCCLTVVGYSGDILEFDLLRETWNRTSFKQLKQGSLVNLERSLPVHGRLHGHFVTGHIDGTGRIEIFEKRGADWYLRAQVGPELLRYIVFKSAIALDGISLTVAEVTSDSFAVWIIPHTLSATALSERSPGDLLNVEADILAKYVEKLVRT